jgi:hypothetical protein
MSHMAKVKLISDVTPAIKFSKEINQISAISLFMMFGLSFLKSRINKQ